MTPAVAADRRLVGTWVKLPAVEVIELLAGAGLDFVIIDLEHGAISVETASRMIGVARAAGLRPFVRVPEATPGYVQPVLDAGAAGIVVPHVEDVAAARAAVRAVRFPPLGARGASPSGRAGRWGTASLSEYLSTDAEIALIAQVESADALAAIREIAAVPGIDTVLIGEVDIAASGGLSLDDPALRDRVDAAENTCREAGIVLGGVAANGSAAVDRFAQGYQLLVVATDLGLLRGGAAGIVETVRGGATGPTPTPLARQLPAIAASIQQELLQLVAAVWYEIDHTDGAGVSAYFTEDASLTISRAVSRGTAEIDELYATRTARGPRVSRHCVTNLHVIEAHESSASALSTLILYAEDGEAPRRRMSPVLVADVEDRFVRRNGRWLIQNRHIKTQFAPAKGGLAVATE
jgi:2-keto-3-deoxy-L-rhamnonate aldolase RhmA